MHVNMIKVFAFITNLFSGTVLRGDDQRKQAAKIEGIIRYINKRGGQRQARQISITLEFEFKNNIQKSRSILHDNKVQGTYQKRLLFQ